MIGVIAVGACGAPSAGRLADDAALPASAASEPRRPLSSTTSTNAIDGHTTSATAGPAATQAARRATRGLPPTLDATTAALRLVDAIDSLRAHDPDPGRLAEIVIPGEPFVAALTSELAGLRRRDERLLLVGVRRVRVHLEPSRVPNDYRLYVDTSAGTRIVTRGGVVVRQERVGAGHWLYAAARWTGGRWFLSLVVQLHPEWVAA